MMKLKYAPLEAVSKKTNVKSNLRLADNVNAGEPTVEDLAELVQRQVRYLSARADLTVDYSHKNHFGAGPQTLVGRPSTMAEDLAEEHHRQVVAAAKAAVFTHNYEQTNFFGTSPSSLETAAIEEKKISAHDYGSVNHFGAVPLESDVEDKDTLAA